MCTWSKTSTRALTSRNIFTSSRWPLLAASNRGDQPDLGTEKGYSFHVIKMKNEGNYVKFIKIYISCLLFLLENNQIRTVCSLFLKNVDFITYPDCLLTTSWICPACKCFMISFTTYKIKKINICSLTKQQNTNMLPLSFHFSHSNGKLTPCGHYLVSWDQLHYPSEFGRSFGQHPKKRFYSQISII